MIIEGVEAGELMPSEVLMVGGGAVGLATAVDLARKGRRVRLLEAGGETLQESSQRLFEQARAIGYPLPGLHLGRFRMLGGTTNFWGGQLLRFDPNIFAARHWVHDDSAWPLDRAELDPFYDHALAMLGMAHHIADDVEIFARLGVRSPALSDDLEFFFTRWTPETNFARLFRDELENRANLHVHLHLPVTGLVVAEGEDRVRGVRCRSRDGADHVLEADHVVLANGTVEIARLLRAPLANGTAAPWANHAWLGEGFMDHLDCYVGDVIPLDKTRFHNLFDNACIDGIKYNPKIKISEEAQQEYHLMSVAGHFIFNSSYAEHLENFKIFARSLLRGRWRSGGMRPTEIVGALRVAAPMVARYLRHRRMYNPADRGIKLRVTSEQRMSRESRLCLRNEHDASGLPVADIDWRIDGVEVETIAWFAERARDWLAAKGLATVEVNPRLMARDPDFGAELEDANHQMGMARMSTGPESGVVDADLCVHGTSNLYVAGAAVFPSTGFANPTFTAIALGLRLAAKLHREGGQRA